MIKALLMIGLVVLTGCVHCPEVPVIGKCTVPAVTLPEDPVDGLNADADDLTIAKAYRESRVKWRSAAKELKTILDSLR